MPRLPLLMSFATIAAVGCGAESPTAALPEALPARATSTAFDPAACGTITGLVTCVGAVPDASPIPLLVPRSDGSGYDTRPIAVANAPHVDRVTRGFAGVVVFLREVNLARARPWDLPPVRVELRATQIVVVQGDRVGRTGFVRRGDAAIMRSVDSEFNVLRGRGAAFFAIPFPDRDLTAERTFETCGRVELTSAAGYFWQAADLFVCDHPYYAVTDADGRFRLPQVPEGRYELVAWHPHWWATRVERNPESGLTTRLQYAPPLERSRPVEVAPGGTTLANLTLPD